MLVATSCICLSVVVFLLLPQTSIIKKMYFQKKCLPDIGQLLLTVILNLFLEPIRDFSNSQLIVILICFNLKKTTKPTIFSSVNMT